MPARSLLRAEQRGRAGLGRCRTVLCDRSHLHRGPIWSLGRRARHNRFCDRANEKGGGQQPRARRRDPRAQPGARRARPRAGDRRPRGRGGATRGGARGGRRAHGAAREAGAERIEAAKAAAEQFQARVKPKLRGVIHEFAFPVALLAGLALVLFVGDTALERVALGIYAVSLAALLGTSALYHRVDWKQARSRLWMRRLDHSMIFLLIAGTITPFAVITLDGPLATAVLITVWTAALAGIVVETIWIDAPKWVSAAVYVGVGSLGAIALPAIIAEAGLGAGLLIAFGGVLYVAGAVITRASARTRDRPSSATTRSSTCWSSPPPQLISPRSRSTPALRLAVRPWARSSRSGSRGAGRARRLRATAAELGPIGPVLAAAFLDDPVWTAIGPRPAATGPWPTGSRSGGSSRLHRHGARSGSPARRGPTRRPPRRSDAAGPAPASHRPARRSPSSPAAGHRQQRLCLGASWALAARAAARPARPARRPDDAGHALEYPDMYLSFHRRRPAPHGTGVGRALMAELHAESDQRAYRPTGTARRRTSASTSRSTMRSGGRSPCRAAPGCGDGAGRGRTRAGSAPARVPGEGGRRSPASRGCGGAPPVATDRVSLRTPKRSEAVSPASAEPPPSLLRPRTGLRRGQSAAPRNRGPRDPPGAAGRRRAGPAWSAHGAVELDDQHRLPPEHVRSVATDPRVRLGHRQPEALTEQHEVALETVRAPCELGEVGAEGSRRARLPSRPAPIVRSRVVSESRPWNSARASTSRSCPRVRR